MFFFLYFHSRFEAGRPKIGMMSVPAAMSLDFIAAHTTWY